MWTGDNMGTWEHMAVGVKMVLANGLGGMSFAGCTQSTVNFSCIILIDLSLFEYVADVGGFFGNPDPEMLVRWYEVGAFAPFFRAHAHIDTKRREPYLLEEPYKSIVRDIIRLRYKLLPVWYTAFRETSVTGVPVLRFVAATILPFPHLIHSLDRNSSSSPKTLPASRLTINITSARLVSSSSL